MSKNKLKTKKVNPQLKQEWDICKLIVFILRHKPSIARLKLDEKGFGNIDEIVSFLQKVRKIKVDKEGFIQAINKHMKKTFEIKGDNIRARFGHSIILSMKTPVNCQPVLKAIPKHLHVLIDSRELGMVSSTGLNSNHLKSDIVSSENSLKLSPTLKLITINAEKAMKNNVEFFQKDDVYFIKFVPPAFLSFKI